MEMLMKARWLTVATTLSLVCGSALAHGSKVHVRGTVEKIAPDSLQIKALDGKTTEVKLAASTVYVLHLAQKSAQNSPGSEDKPAQLADLAVGDLVVIHATPKGDQLEADEVKFSLPKSRKDGPRATQKPKS